MGVEKITAKLSQHRDAELPTTNRRLPGVGWSDLVMQTDISRRHIIEQDAKRLEETANFIRSVIDEDWAKMPEWKRHEKERELRTRIKYAIETLLQNMPC